MLDLGFLPDVERIVAMTPDNRQTMLFSATMPGVIVDPGPPLHAPAHAHPRDEPRRRDGHGRHRRAARLPRARDGQARAAGPHPAGRGPRPDHRLHPHQARAADASPTTSSERGFAAAAVHGDLGQGAREQALRAFRTGKVDVLVATDVAARGIDVDGVTHVINYTCPEDEKTYLHRIGRTGRAGDDGRRRHVRRLGRPAALGDDQQGARPRRSPTRRRRTPPRTGSTRRSTSRRTAKGMLPRAAAHPCRPGRRGARGPRRDRQGATRRPEELRQRERRPAGFTVGLLVRTGADRDRDQDDEVVGNPTEPAPDALGRVVGPGVRTGRALRPCRPRRAGRQPGRCDCRASSPAPPQPWRLGRERRRL